MSALIELQKSWSVKNSIFLCFFPRTNKQRRDKEREKLTVGDQRNNVFQGGWMDAVENSNCMTAVSWQLSDMLVFRIRHKDVN